MISNNLTLESALTGNSKTAAVITDAKTTATTTSTESKKTSFEDAYLLDLSEAAKKILAGNVSTEAKKEAKLTQPFVLNAKQKAKIDEIMNAHKNEPVNKETFQKIEAELKSEGLGYERLAAVNSAYRFKTKISLFSALNGSAVALAKPEQNIAQMKTEGTQYRKGIYNYWLATSNQQITTPKTA